MGYDNENGYRRSLVFDIETYPIDGAADYLEPVSAPSNYSKPEAIASYIAKETANQLSKCALDPDLCRIVALGAYRSDSDWAVDVARDERDEAVALAAFWESLQRPEFRSAGDCAAVAIPQRKNASVVDGEISALGRGRRDDVPQL